MTPAEVRALIERVEAEERSYRLVSASSSLRSNTSVSDVLAVCRLLREALEEIGTFIHHVPDPKAPMALHYAECPFEPFADLPNWEMPDPRPVCTCAKEHIGLYWKARWMLDMGQQRQRAEVAEERVRELEDGSLVNTRMVWLEGRVRELEAVKTAVSAVLPWMEHYVGCPEAEDAFNMDYLNKLLALNAALAASEA